MGPLTRLQRWQHWWPRLEPCPTSRSGSSPGPSLSSKNCTLVQPRACIINIVLSCPVILYVFIVKKKALFLYQNKQPLSFLFWSFRPSLGPLYLHYGLYLNLLLSLLHQKISILILS